MITGDCRTSMELCVGDGEVQTCVTSPPYFGLRDYGHDGQIGLEPTPNAYVDSLVEVFREVRRVLRDDGTVWLNLGDSYAGNGGLGVQSGKEFEYRFRGQEKVCRSARVTPIGMIKARDLVGIPWRVAFALQADGWYLRQDIIWSKPNPMPESVKSRCTKAHEYLFLLSKSAKSYCNMDAIKEPATGRAPGNKTHKSADAAAIRSANGDHGERTKLGLTSIGAHETRNKRDVWEVASAPYKGAHFATFPPMLVEPCILAGSRPGDVVLDPFAGSGITGMVAEHHGRAFIGCELNAEYVALAEARIAAGWKQR